MLIRNGRRLSSHPDGVDPSAMPPSTLAAQILQTRSTSVVKQEPGHREQFNKLLIDFLNDPVIDAEEGKVKENARFLSFLLEAALESRARNEPFGSNSLSQQAIDCLKAVRLTIDRHPEILLSSRDDTSEQSSPPPLLLWLIEKILCIASTHPPNDGWDQLGAVLAGSQISLSAKPSLWLHGQATFQLFRAVVESTSPLKLITPPVSRFHRYAERCRSTL
jgi:hypothetical protein